MLFCIYFYIYIILINTIYNTIKESDGKPKENEEGSVAACNSDFPSAIISSYISYIRLILVTIQNSIINLHPM